MQVVAPNIVKKDGYSKFLGVFRSISDQLKTLEECKNSLKVMFGANLLKNRIDGDIIYMHPIEVDLDNIVKFIKYEAGSEEGVALLMLNAFCNEIDNDELRSFIDELDVGYLSAESSVSEEELEEAKNIIDAASRATIVVADDIYTHESVENIAAILATISKYSKLNVVALKPKFPTEYDTEILKVKITEPEYLPSYDGAVVYSVLGDEDCALKGSKQFALAAKVRDGQVVNFEVNGVEFNKKFELDSHLKGTIAINPTSNLKVLSSYRFQRIKINKVGSEDE